MLENVAVLAGIPAIMQVMLDIVTPKLKTGRPFLTRTVRVVVPESLIAATLKDVQAQYSNLSLGSYPFFENNELGTHLVLRSTDAQPLDSATEMLITRLREENLDPRIVET